MFRPLRVYLILTKILYPFEFLRSFAVLDHYVYNWPLRVFYTLLRCWRRLWRLARYVYNWSLRVSYTLLSLSRRLWHFDHYVYVWPSRLFRPFCAFDIVSREWPLWVRYSVCCGYTITSVCLTFWSYIPFWPLWPLIWITHKRLHTGGKFLNGFYRAHAVPQSVLQGFYNKLLYCDLWLRSLFLKTDWACYVWCNF